MVEKLKMYLMDYVFVTHEYPNIIVTKHNLMHNDETYPLTEKGIDRFWNDNFDFIKKLEFVTNFDRLDLFSLI